MVGKRKNRDDDAELGSLTAMAEPQSPKGTTLFVSNLPYTATSVDLQTLFSDIAPVRSAFVVLDKESRKSKGVGYVSFAVKEDAALAVAQIEKEGLVIDRRNLRVQFADSKWHDAEGDKPLSPKVEKPPRRVHHSQTNTGAADPFAIRTVVISGLPSTIDSHALWKKLRKVEGIEKIQEWPAKTTTGEDPTIAHALFSTAATAQDAVSRLHSHVFKGSLLSVVLKKRLDTLVKSGGNPTRASRLIVRNLPWNVTETDLRQLFLPYGPVHLITIPVAEPDEESGKLRAKGFAFVWMMSKKDAERAIEGINGSTIGGGTGMETNDKGEERVIAVDWALSKRRWEAEKERIMEQDEEVSQASDTSSEGEESRSEESHVGIHEGSDDKSEASSEDDEDEEDPPERPQLPHPETGNTLFIRNVPFESTEDELRTLFRSFGPLRYARITMDAVTGRSRGTGFVCFWNKEDADKAIQQAELLNAETGATQALAANKNPFKFSSILTPDPSSSLAHSLVLHGRTLSVTRAVTREEASRLRELSQKQREKQDKRNLYLMREGVVFPNMPAASTLSEVELEKRVQAFNTRRALLRSNPSLYVSKTRLSVRQIPIFVTERTLKRLAIHAVRAFEEEVRHGVRQALSEEELREITVNEGTEPDADEKPKKKRKHNERQTAVRQAKIVRVGDRVDPITGKGRSKGYGFLEMVSHADALRVLRWANNHPGVEGLMRGWWMEELKEMIQRQEARDKKDEEDEARLRRMKDRLKEFEGEKDKKTGWTLVLEFSIENIQVVKRRQERQSEISKEQPAKLGKEKAQGKKRREDPGSELEDESQPTKKARVVANTEKIKPTKKAMEKGNLGKLIGRKRKQKSRKST